MTPLLVATATALHALATVVFIGYYLLLSMLYLPVLAKSEFGGGASLLERCAGDSSRACRSRLWRRSTVAERASNSLPYDGGVSVAGNS